MVTCERSWEVDAMREGRLTAADAESFERHMRTCATCRSQFVEDEKLRALGQRLEPARADEVSVRRMRANVLRAANAPGAATRGRWLLVAAAMMVFAVAVLWVEVRPRAASVSAPAAAFVGSVTGDGRYTQARFGTEERVTLQDGSVAIHVHHLGPNERFVVELPDGELEVRGTTFEVTVSGGATRHASVSEGRVALRLEGLPAMLLAAGDAWSRPAAAAAASSVASAAAATSAAPAASAVASHARVDASANAYEDAVRVYRRGEFEQAAVRFRAFATDNPGAPEAEDAAYLAALSLARAGHTDAAGAEAQAFLRRFPGSFHEKEATVLVARAAAAQRDCATVRRVLAPFAEDDDTRALRASCAE